MLPIDIQMQIDITAAAHAREIAEGFAAARARLLPEPAPDPWRAVSHDHGVFLNPPIWLQQALAADHGRGDWTHYNAAQTGQYDPFGSPLGPAATGLLGSLGL